MLSCAPEAVQLHSRSAYARLISTVESALPVITLGAVLLALHDTASVLADRVHGAWHV